MFLVLPFLQTPYILISFASTNYTYESLKCKYRLETSNVSEYAEGKKKSPRWTQTEEEQLRIIKRNKSKKQPQKSYATGNILNKVFLLYKSLLVAWDLINKGVILCHLVILHAQY